MDSDEDVDEGHTSRDRSEEGSGRGRGTYRGRGYRGRGRGGRGRGGSSNLAKQKSRSTSSLTGGARDRTEDTDAMDEDDIFDEIVKREHGRVTYQKFKAMLRGHDVRKWIESRSERFVIFENNSGFINSVGIRVPKAKMCNFYFKQGCTRDSCTYFHLCISHVCGYCQYGEQCSKSHHFQDEHNRNALRYMDLADRSYSARDLAVIIRESSPHLCHWYNSAECKNGDACTRMHVCSEYVKKKRCDNSSCNLEHDFRSAHSVRLLKSFGLERHLGSDNGADVIRRSLLIERHNPQDHKKNSENQGRGGRGRGRAGGNQRGYRRSSSNSRPSVDPEERIRDFDDNYTTETMATERRPEPALSALPLPKELVVKPRTVIESGYKEKNDVSEDDFSSDFMDRLNVNGGERTEPRHTRRIADKPKMKSTTPLMPTLPSKPNVGQFMSSRHVQSASEFAPSAQKVSYICIDHLSNNCDLGTHCPDQHHSKKYRWLIQAFGEQKEVHNIESKFANPDIAAVRFKVPDDIPVYGGAIAGLDFINMRAVSEDHSEFKVERISTRSFCEVSSSKHATVWHWFWKGDDGKFQEYGVEEMIDLERTFLRGVRTKMMKREAFSYNIDFVGMKQINSLTQRSREIRRRPHYS